MLGIHRDHVPAPHKPFENHMPHTFKILFYLLIWLTLMAFGLVAAAVTKSQALQIL